MAFDRLSKRLEGLEDASKKGYPIQNLYHCMLYLPEIWQEAYARIYSNKGAITKGVNENTLDGMSFQRIENIIKTLKEETYKPTPAKRVYIPKRSGKLRPLGIPTGDDKLVQEVVRIILERIYEPVFLDESHGFRTERSCHTALEQIQRNWTGVKWFIEFDIKGFFDNMNHDIMTQLLEKKIDDKRFINLIKVFLKAGYLEDWAYHQTYSGTPQGGIVSPILSNIYLHELDEYAQETMRQFNKGKKRPRNPEYQRIEHLRRQVRREISQKGKKPELIRKYREFGKQLRELPTGDTHTEEFKRLKYCRYADDFIMGVIGTYEDSERIKSKIEEFLKSLDLQVAEEKTRIEAGKEGIHFLSYEISTWRTDKVKKVRAKGITKIMRTVHSQIFLKVPIQKVINFCDKYGYGNWEANEPTHRAILLSASEAEIIETYNAELRGLASYYSLANDVKTKLNKLAYLSQYSLIKTLAAKSKVGITQIHNTLRKGNELVYRFNEKGKYKEFKVFQLKHMEHKPKQVKDDIVNTIHLTASTSELIRRINAKECEYCGKQSPTTEAHHVHKVKDLKEKPHLKMWQKIMIAKNRKTLILCAGTPDSCHELLHKGKLPDERDRPKNI
ncbi:hypothetical protein HYR99_12085 [Candidatus Poribacteria bacterium]|nr:hypothetical protein [Candidatus Poribacteria bacterium]